jgi:DNA polymerase-1
MKYQKLYGGVRLLGDGPCESNVNLLDMGAVPMLTHMMRRGMQVDLSHFAKMEVELQRDMERITEEVKSMTGHYINLNSGDQVADLLFKKLGLKQARPKMTKSGDRESVEDEVLTAIQHDHPVVPKIQDFKEYSKLKGTYVQPIPKLAVRVGMGRYRLSSNLGHTRVPSGRYNCKEPNLLAMPTRTERGKDIRKGFITDDGWSYLSVDMSQIEVRVAAHCSKDPDLMQVYFNDEDVYSDFATSSFRLEDKRYKNDDGVWKYPTVDKEKHRFPSKTCVLASIYDVTAEGLSAQMPVMCGRCNKKAIEHTCNHYKPLWTENKCQDMLNSFYIKYPGILSDRKKYHSIMRHYGYIYDMWGRLLHVAAVRSVLPWVVSGALREGANEPYQGGAGGCLKLTMAKTYDDFEQANLLDVCHPLLPIHDELLLECRNDVVEEVGVHIADNFSSCVRLNVPIKASYASAESWGTIDK